MGLVCASLCLHSFLTFLHAVLQANANSVRASIKNPRLGSPHLHRQVGWELDNVILPPLRITAQLLRNRAISNALVGIESFAADVLGAVQTFVEAMDWTGPERNPGRESSSFEDIIREIVWIHINQRSQDFDSSFLGKALGNTYRAGMRIDYSAVHTVS